MRLLASSATILLGAAWLQASPVLTLQPVSQTVGAGSTAAVQVSVSGLKTSGGALSLGAFDVGLQFDPTVVAVNGVSFGDPVLGDQLDLSGVGAISGSMATGAGAFEFYEISLDAASVLNVQQADHFVLATLQLKAIGGGATLLVPSVFSASDGDARALSLPVQNASIAVTAVPEPNMASVLFLSALALMFLARDRVGTTPLTR